MSENQLEGLLFDLGRLDTRLKGNLIKVTGTQDNPLQRSAFIVTLNNSSPSAGLESALVLVFRSRVPTPVEEPELYSNTRIVDEAYGGKEVTLKYPVHDVILSTVEADDEFVAEHPMTGPAHRAFEELYNGGQPAYK